MFPALMAWEYGPMASGAFAVEITCLDALATDCAKAGLMKVKASPTAATRSLVRFSIVALPTLED
jgi:hypothetical protein